MNEDSNKKKVSIGIVLLITLLVVLLLGCIGFIVYDKFIKNDINNLQTEGKAVSNKEELKNATEEVSKLSNFLSVFFEYDKKGKNLILYPEFRLELVEIMLPNESILTYNESEVQEFPYVKYSIFKQKYTELFGNSDNLDSDISEVMDPVATTDSTYVGKGYVSWNNTYGVFRTFILTATSIEKKILNIL